MGRDYTKKFAFKDKRGIMIKNYFRRKIMALINCPECKKEVSDSASSCPFCGYSVAKHVKKEKSKKLKIAFFDNIRYRKPVIRKWCKFSFVASFLICLIISICLYNHYDKAQIEAKQAHDDIEQAILEGDPNVDINYFKGMANQLEIAENMEKNKNLTFPVAFGTLAIVEILIFIVFKKTTPSLIDEIETAEASSSKTNENPTHLAWNKLYATQDNKRGRCDLCGKRHQPIVFFEFEDRFGKGQGNICYNCFCEKYK